MFKFFGDATESDLHSCAYNLTSKP